MTSPLKVRIEKLVPGGEGLSHIEGKVILVPYVLPDELVEVNIVQDKTQYFRGSLSRILEPSDSRINPVCPLFTKCGGCDWLHIDYHEQTNQKIELIKEAFRRTGKMTLPEFEMVSGESLGYRDRAQFHKNQDGKLGFMERHSNNVIPIQKCAVLNSRIEDFLSRYSSMAHIKIPDNKKIRLFSDSSTNISLLQQLEDNSREIEINILGKKILFDSDCFFQSNMALLPDLIKYAIKDLQGNTAMDLFCGTGLFGAFLKDSFETIIAVDISKKNLDYARKNIPGKNNLFLKQDVSQLKESLSSFGNIDCVVVDPPRNGLTSQARDFLLRLSPPRIIYVSCNPVTQARDTRELSAHNYRVSDFKAFDFYPQTSHCETVLKLDLHRG